MLDLAKIDSGKMVLRSDRVNLFDVIEDLCKLSIPLKKAGVELKTSFAKNGTACHQNDPAFCIMADAQRWRQVLLNLVSNALRFTQIGYVHISVEVFTAKRKLRVSVMDTGPGISASDAARLFQKYEQVHNTNTSGGSGLGLVLAQKIATLWGSTVEIKSPWQSERAGSMFHFTINWAPAAQCVNDGNVLRQGHIDPVVTDSAALLGAKLSGANVLLVEDEALNTLLMTTKLTKSSELAKYNFEVSPIASADEAMTLLEKDPNAFDIIIMDEHFECEPDVAFQPSAIPETTTTAAAATTTGNVSTPLPFSATAETTDELQEGTAVGSPVAFVLGSDPGRIPGGQDPWRPLRGSEAIRQLREMGCTRSIISCSGNCLDDDAAAYQNAGATISWPKPYPTALAMEQDLLRLCEVQRSRASSQSQVKADVNGPCASL
jgi:CheY-like chemotaxis protein